MKKTAKAPKPDTRATSLHRAKAARAPEVPEDARPGWEAFLASPRAETLSADHRARLASFPWPKAPDAANYEILAIALGMNETRERDAAERAQRAAESRARLVAEREAKIAAQREEAARERREHAERMARAEENETDACREAVALFTAIEVRRAGLRSVDTRGVALEIVRQVAHYVPAAQDRLDLYGAIGLAGDYLETLCHRSTPDLAARAAESLDTIDGFDFRGAHRTVPRELVLALHGAIHGCDWRVFLRWILATGEQLEATCLDDLALETVRERTEQLARAV